jgi:hypothetical protein
MTLYLSNCNMWLLSKRTATVFIESIIFKKEAKQTLASMISICVPKIVKVSLTYIFYW